MNRLLRSPFRHRLALRFLAICCAMLGSSIWSSALSAQEPSAPPPAPPQCEFSILAPGHTLILQLNATLDGLPFGSAIQPRFAAVFARLDRDADQRLTAAELAAAPSAGWLRRLGWGYLPVSHSEPITLAAADANQDGAADLAEVQAWYQAHGVATVVTVTGRSNITAVLTEVLWRSLDQDGDGRLSAAERASGPDVLSRLDEDDDGVIGGHEVSASIEQVYAFGVERAREPCFALAGAAVTDEPLQAPLSVRFGLAPASAAVLPGDLFAAPSGVTATALPQGLSLTWPECRCTIVGALSEPERRRQSVVTLAEGHFAAADRDADQCLTAEEAAAAPRCAFASAFRFLDANADDRLTEDEWRTGLDLLVSLSESSLHLTVLAHERALFEALDENRDGRLTQAEVQAVPALDCDSASALPSAVTVFVSLGPPRVAAISSAPGTPAWFVAMDRNGDALLTRAEFLGDAAAFASFDRNQDGRLTVEEAGQ